MATQAGSKLWFALAVSHHRVTELELELIQTHMAQKPLLRVEVCAQRQ
jgi:hypothetical protein